MVESENEEEKRSPPAFLTAVLTQGVEDRNVRNLLADFRRQSDSRYQPKRPQVVPKEPKKENGVVPKYYCSLSSKAMPLVYSSHSPISKISPQYCVRPWVASMYFYGELDMPLGIFLEEFCFGYDEKCPHRNCTTPLRDHVRRFCLANTCVTLNVQEVESNIMTNSTTIQAWRFCTQCEMVTPILFLNDDAWMYSFAMFFLLLIHEERIKRRGSTAALCNHSLHKDHHICFSKGETLASFKVASIVPNDLVMPPTQLQMPSAVPVVESLMLELKVLSVHGSSVFSQINEKLVKIKSESNKTSVSGLLTEQEKEFESYKSTVEQISANVSTHSHLTEMKTSILMLKVSLLKTIRRWNSKLLHLQQEVKKSSKEMSGSNNAGRSRVPSGSGSVSSLQETPRSSVSSVTSSEHDSVRKRNSTKDSNNADFHINSPFSPKLHPDLYLAPGVLVDEEQPSSIIAYTLATNEYQNFIETSPESTEDEARKISGNGDAIHPENGDKSPSKLRRKSKKNAELLKHHFQYSFSDETCEFYCSVLFAREFENFREDVVGSRKRFLTSMSSCNRFRASGGKSGVHFYKTNDDRFLLKELNRQESKDFNRFAPKYLAYLEASQKNREPTLLAKIVGGFEVGYNNSSTGNSFGMVFIVMENLTFKRKVTGSYDLKGSLRNRMVDEDNAQGSYGPYSLVLMDENLLKTSRENPFYITEESKVVLTKAINNDTSFLEQNLMMDYSLLVAIDGSELVLGIIDYIRVYTWDKQLESLIKSTGLLGGAGKSPTVVAPDVYKKRFEHSMNKYFTLVPDFWYQQDDK